MRLETLCYRQSNGWDASQFPDLDSETTLVIIFGSPEFIDHQGPVHDLVKAYPKSHIIGCSTSGEIFGNRVQDHSLSVALIAFDHTDLETASAPVSSASESFAAGQSLANQLQQADLKGVFVLSDGLNVNGSELVRGLNSVLPPSVIVTGGLAGDGDKFVKTWILHNGELATKRVSAIGFYGDMIQLGHGSKGGWDIFGPYRKVTRSAGNVLFELDGQPALKLYKEYLGELASGLPATGLLFPLALSKNTEDSKQLVRTILAVDEGAQSLTFAGDVPEGYMAQLMRANFDRLVCGAEDAAQMIQSQTMNGKEILSIAISCVGRRLVLGERTEEEVEAILAVLPKNVKQIGFYSYGEISPYTTGSCDLHNQTMTLTMISEASVV